MFLFSLELFRTTKLLNDPFPFFSSFQEEIYDLKQEIEKYKQMLADEEKGKYVKKRDKSERGKRKKERKKKE